MNNDTVQAMIRDTFLDMAQALESGRLGGRPRIALTGPGGELGEENALQGARLAASQGVDVAYIGSLTADNVTHIPAQDEQQAHQAMEQLLQQGAVSGAVTMHYPFPIGVATVGRALLPANGRELFIATTTGTAATGRVPAMVLGALYGVITARACGYDNPSLGILNVDGARQVEMILKKLMDNGFPLRLAASGRADGGCIMRGNDVLGGAADIMVMDSLTGNVITKMLSSFGSGGRYEALGYGYGPGIGQDYERLVLIVSRASGARVIAGALQFAATLVENNYRAIVKAQFAQANAAGLQPLLQSCAPARQAAIAAPPKEPVTADIAGIDVMDLDNAVALLWQKGIYAESGMGCTGPIVLVAPGNLLQAADALRQGGYLS